MLYLHRRRASQGIFGWNQMFPTQSVLLGFLHDNQNVLVVHSRNTETLRSQTRPGKAILTTVRRPQTYNNCREGQIIKTFLYRSSCRVKISVNSFDWVLVSTSLTVSKSLYQGFVKRLEIEKISRYIPIF